MSPALSCYLDGMRLLAAMLVYLSHANASWLTGNLPVLWRISNLGNEAVMMFFVLSGFVIAFVTDKKEHTAREYLLSRFARLYSVAIPAIVLAFVSDSIGQSLSPSTY